MTFLALALLLAAQRPDYVPDSGWHDNEWRARFNERWYGNQLHAMREPPLATRADLNGWRGRFRLLVLPSFRPAYAYRIDLGRQGGGTLRAVVLSGRGGYAPGRLVRQERRPLTATETGAFQEALAAAALDSVPRDTQPEGATTDADGNEIMTVCTDGTTYVIEYLSPEGRRYVTRSCGIDEAPLQRLATMVIDLAPGFATD